MPIQGYVAAEEQLFRQLIVKRISSVASWPTGAFPVGPGIKASTAIQILTPATWPGDLMPSSLDASVPSAFPSKS
jgi:hypothetical protein